MLAGGFGSLDAALATTAEEICPGLPDPCNVTTQRTITDPSILDFGNRALRVQNGGALRVGSGMMTIRARSVTVDLGGSLTGLGTMTQPGGLIIVEAEDIILNGTITVSGAPGGLLRLHATDQLEVRNSIVGDSLAEPNEPPADFVLEGHDILITGGISGIGAGLENAGGDITINAAGDVEISSLINMSGGEGGIITIFAGASVEGGGNITLHSASELRADGLNPGNGDGDISIDATGDGIETGHIILAGRISAIGRTGSFDTGGGTGGCVDIASSGDVRGEPGAPTRGSIIVEGGAPDGSGGLISLDVGGELDLDADIVAGSRGQSESEGGSICVDVSGDAILSGTITNIAGGGGAGDITVESDDGTVRIDGSIDVSAVSEGRGGAVCLASGGFGIDQASSVIVNGAIRANGAGAGGGGAIELDGSDLVQTIGPLSVNGGASGAIGGTIIISVTDGPAILQGAVNGIGSGGGSAGGIFTVDAEGRITLTGPIDVRAQGGNGRLCSISGAPCQDEDDCLPGDVCRARGGGLVDLTSTGPIDLNGPINASSNGGGGGRVDLLSDADVRFANSVSTDGITAAPGGRVEALACMVTVCGQNNPLCPAGTTGNLTSRGSGGTNRLVGRGRREIGSSEIETSVVVLGSIIATAANQLVYTQGGQEPVVFGSANPTASFIADANLTPCPICGNSATEPPEECDDGNTNDGDGCSSICQMEEPVLGDANGDQQVTADDVDDLILEIFDGDGDSVTTVSSPMGTFPGNPGADANEDRLINAADVTRTIVLIGTGAGG
jgi:cysteine-rich repeat protein